MQPVIVLLVSPILFKESVTLRKIVCVVVALFGMMLVSGIMSPSDTVQGVGNTKGVLLGLGAAALYAAVVLLNKKIVGVPVYEKTIVQLLSASIALIPYMLLHGTLHHFELESLQLILLIAVGILHTGIAYALYFSSVEHLPVQTAALFSYIDPVTAVLLSALLYRSGDGSSAFSFVPTRDYDAGRHDRECHDYRGFAVSKLKDISFGVA